jgi:hypothetical protein
MNTIIIQEQNAGDEMVNLKKIKSKPGRKNE